MDIDHPILVRIGSVCLYIAGRYIKIISYFFHNLQVFTETSSVEDDPSTYYLFLERLYRIHLYKGIYYSVYNFNFHFYSSTYENKRFNSKENVK